MGFDRTLKSDVDEDTAHKLLNGLKGGRGWIAGLSDENISDVAKSFTVIRCKKGEEVLVTGEQASFFAVVLEGAGTWSYCVLAPVSHCWLCT